MKVQHRQRGCLILYKRKKTIYYHCQFSWGGKQIKRSTQETVRSAAWKVACGIYLQVTGRKYPGAEVINFGTESSAFAFEHYFEELRDKRVHTTVQRAANHLRLFAMYFGDRALATLTKDDVENWRKWMLHTYESEKKSPPARAHT